MRTDSLLAAGYAPSGSVVLVTEEFDETAPAVSPDASLYAAWAHELRGPVSARSSVNIDSPAGWSRREMGTRLVNPFIS